MPFTLDKVSGLPLNTIDNGDGTTTLIIASYGDVMLSSIAVFENPKLTGDVTLSASGGAILTQLGNNIVVYAPSGGAGGGVASLNSETGAITIAPSGAVQVTTAGSTITIYAPTASAGGGSPGNIVSLSSGAASAAVTFATPFGSIPALVVGLSSSIANDIISAQPWAISASGFNAQFSTQTPDNTYSLNWIASVANG